MTDNHTSVIAAGDPNLAIPDREPDESNFHYLERLMAMLPPPDGDAADDLVGKILGSESMHDENDLWEASSTQRLVGKRYVFESVFARPSDQGEGLAYFLVCRVIDAETGERDTITTGSLNVCASLMRRAMLGELPAEAVIEGPKRKLDNGRVPLHLRWTGRKVR